MFTDEDLDTYIDKIQTCNKTQNKLAYYKKATKRLNKLKNEYESMVENLRTDSTPSTDSGEDSTITIESIVSELDKITEVNTSDDINFADISETIDYYKKYKKLVNKLTEEISDVKNTLYSVNVEEEDFLLTKINMDSL